MVFFELIGDKSKEWYLFVIIWICLVFDYKVKVLNDIFL